MTNSKPVVKLINEDGNAFKILACCRQAAIDANWTKSEISKFQSEATSGDYNHLLQVVTKYFEVI